MSTFTESRRVALITGCSEPTSLGSHLALELLSRGWRVIATARKVQTMAALEAKGCDTLALDVCSSDSVAAAVDQVKKSTSGRLDLIINNAGVTGTAAYLDTDPQALTDMFDIHVVGPMRVIQAFASMLIKTANSPSNDYKKTTIINTGSVISLGMPWHTAYAATKAALQVSSDALRTEMAPLGVQVITLELALVQTAMTAAAKPFNVSKAGTSAYSNWNEIIETVTSDFAKETANAPLPKEVARQMIDAAEKSQSPGKLWLGADANLFRFMLPMLPIKMRDSALGKRFRTSMIKRPS